MVKKQIINTYFVGCQWCVSVMWNNMVIEEVWKSKKIVFLQIRIIGFI